MNSLFVHYEKIIFFNRIPYKESLVNNSINVRSRMIAVQHFLCTPSEESLEATGLLVI